MAYHIPAICLTNLVFKKRGAAAALSVALAATPTLLGGTGGLHAQDTGAGAVNVTSADVAGIIGIGIASTSAGGGVTVDSSADTILRRSTNVIARDIGASAIDLTVADVTSGVDGILTGALDSTTMINRDSNADVTGTTVAGIGTHSTGGNANITVQGMSGNVASVTNGMDINTIGADILVDNLASITGNADDGIDTASVSDNITTTGVDMIASTGGSDILTDASAGDIAVQDGGLVSGITGTGPIGGIIIGGASALSAPNTPPTISPSPSGGDARDDQSVILSLPVLRADSPIGEAEVSVSPNGDARFESLSISRILEPLLSESGKVRLAEAIGTSTFIDEARLKEYGFQLDFDMGQLEVVVESIDPELQQVVGLASSNNRFDQLPPTVDQAGFSAYLNLAGNFDYTDGVNDSGLRDPDILGFGAIRSGRFAIQYEGGLTERTNDDYGLYRRFVRGIFDIEQQNLRVSAGDLQTNTLSILGSQLVGGVGIERSRRLFDPFDPVFQLGGRRLKIDSPSTLEIVNNGAVVRTITVDRGVYNLDELPLVFGANDVDIVIRDAAGRESVTNFNYFYDPVDLEVGDFEYGAYVGLISDVTSLDPSYGGDISATGFYRRAFTPSFLAGAGVQLSEDVQVVAGEVRWVPQVIPGVIESQAALSSGSDGLGYSARMGYRWGRTTITGGQQISAILDYESSKFELVGRPRLLNEERLSVTLSYGQSITTKTYASTGLSYFKRSNNPARSTIFADATHQFNPRLRGTAGVEYGKNDGFGTAFGVRVGLTLLFGQNSRADTSYSSRRDSFRAGTSRAIENHVGAFGYDVNVERDDGRSTADAALRYRGNRFDSRLLVSGTGDGFGNITDERRAQLQLSTALAYADGGFGVGRTITDGFALVSPHPNIEGKAIVGNDLNNGEYQGRSGLLGAAVVPDILGYQNREVVYDIDTTETVYDVGDGSDRLRLATGGGARIIVGSARFVSAIGTLQIGDGPASLISGTVSSETDVGFEPLPFFTNSVGRFSVIGLSPGERYTVRLRDGREFVLDIPASNKGLYRAATIKIEEAGK